MASFIFALINSEGLLWCTRVHSKCVPIHFLKVCCEKTSLLWYGPHMGRLHLLFITSWLYFSSKFQAGVQSAKKETLPVCVCVSTTVIPLCENADRAPSLSGITARILFPPCRNISQYLGIYRPLILAGHRLVRIPCGPSQSPHEPPAF